MCDCVCVCVCSRVGAGDSLVVNKSFVNLQFGSICRPFVFSGNLFSLELDITCACRVLGATSGPYCVHSASWSLVFVFVSGNLFSLDITCACRFRPG